MTKLAYAIVWMGVGVWGCQSDAAPADSGAGDTGADDARVSDGGGTDAATVASCEAALRAKHDACVASAGSRQCEYLEYAKLCRVGDPVAITGLFACFRDGECWSPADANTRRACVDDAIRRDNPGIDAVVGAVCARCPDIGGCGDGIPYAIEGLPPAFVAAPARSAFGSCVSAATTCEAVRRCFVELAASVPAFFPNNRCE